ncbi:hypothetical protein TBLA_0C01360 [Henningerozyma blattae CBS 6284]|uniref:Methyltransferase domain-containing protein n=1 Tax=Henningerozyma blattae (strain ATCC 34711 / CBS 6284 / DSM 70876 / NBRC 10599 / NRRL Y-10934 / UCD 77-7) TaxID=1071380 RepID=I2H0P9_HENB6|nr:hypothetical protein TBLA_0C01360 [Tetrapisispora blattae CBS 6284]CCH59951.1 hypothetical protein TBLA_0C01360 [Tetrapisispora blattae CBS 6284]
MSQFSEKDFDAINYADFRPTYSIEFYKKMNEYHEGEKNLLIDVGCGPGTATLQLVNLLKFKKTIGTDISKPMVDGGNNLKQKDSNVEFLVSSGEDFQFLGEEFNAKKVDMITAAECVHYIGFNIFQENCWKNLRKNGTLAIWGYVNPTIAGHPKVDKISFDYFYSADKFGPYWQQPGGKIISNLLQDCKWDETKYKDIKNVVMFARDYGTGVNEDELYFGCSSTPEGLRRYFTTTSFYHGWKKDHPNEKDLSESFLEEVLAACPDLKANSKVQIVFDTFYMFARAI